MVSLFERVRNLFGNVHTLQSYDQAKALASDHDPEVRKKVAERSDIKPEILYFLAEDSDPAVRQEIAKNEATPRQADAILASDDDLTVRSHLARKIASLTPMLNSTEREDIRQLTVEILEQLARDQVPKIRAILAHSLQYVAAAPVSVMRQLALDDELDVSVPVLENSPVLRDEDLLYIIRNRPKTGALSAISRRNIISFGISEALISTDSKEAITDLLKNKSAQIREEMLDLLVERSREVPVWHEPLVRRPELPSSAAIRLAEFVADKYLNILEQRRDLDEGTLLRVKKEVYRRIEGEGPMSNTEDGNESDDETIRIGGNKNASAFAAAKRLSDKAKIKFKS